MRESSFSWTESDVRRLIAGLGLSTAVLVTAILITRLPASGARLSPWWTLAATTFVGGLGAISIAALTLRTACPPRWETLSALACIVSGLTAASTLATTTRSGTGQLAFGCLLSVALTGGLLYWTFIAGRGSRDTIVDAGPQADDSVAPSVAFRAPDSDVDGGAEDAGERPAGTLPDHVDQTVSRYSMDGRDHLEACLRVRFEPGQQTAIVHLPIQPAMQFDPEVECETVSGQEVRIAVDPPQPYGVRLVCRRSTATQASESVIAVLISADRVVRAAA